MGRNSAVSWIDDTLQIVTGCAPAGIDCHNCYSARLCGTRLSSHPRCRGLTTRDPAGRHVWTGEVRCHADQLEVPRHWRRPRRIFLADRGDLFHRDVPTAFQRSTFDLIRDTKRHDYVILTKRPELMAAYVLDREPTPLSNMRLGVSAGNQELFDARWRLLATIAEAGWSILLSLEPLIGAIEPPNALLDLGPRAWVIVGGESGRDARACDVRWIRRIVERCLEAGVPVFVKQLGRRCAVDPVPAVAVEFNDAKGADPTEWPEELRVQQYPSRAA